MSDEQPSGWLAFRAELVERMTPVHAAAVERLRVERGLTWRGVAEAFYDEFPDALYDGKVRENQIVGVFLCEAAGEILGRPVD